MKLRCSNCGLLLATISLPIQPTNAFNAYCLACDVKRTRDLRLKCSKIAEDMQKHEVAYHIREGHFVEDDDKVPR